MTILEGLLQGFIQGLTEFLPVSSSGHLSLFQHFTGNAGAGSLFFSLMLHLGTLAAVIAAYYEDLWEMIKEFGGMVKEIFTRKFHFKTDNLNRKMIYMLVLATLPLVLVVPINGWVTKLAEDGDIVVEGICFLFTSLLLFMACKARPGKAGISRMKPRSALTVGVMQAVAAIPGISRSGATISTGLVLGFDRAFMVKFSFLLGIPAILGGAVFEIGDAAKENVDIPLAPLFLGMLTAAVVGYICIRLVRWLVVTNKFIVFAWYTLVLGGVVVIIGIVEHLMGAGADPATAKAASDIVSSVASGAGSGSGSALAMLGALFV